MIVQLTKMAPGAGHGGVERVVGQIRQIFVETGIENEVWCFGDGSKQGEDRRGAIRAFKKSLSWHSTAPIVERQPNSRSRADRRSSPASISPRGLATILQPRELPNHLVAL
jgi:hypothetical protein